MADPTPRRDTPPEEVRDELPEDLDVTGYVGPYTFPDIAKRRIPALLYLAVATACFALWAVRGDGVFVNDGFLWVALGLLAVAAYGLSAAWELEVREGEALLAAVRAVGFPVGHASAQLMWRGLRSRPTWRILLYSAEEPPATRGLVVVDGVDGEVLHTFTEANPEDWSQYR